MCGPFCSVPPVGTISVVVPARTRSRTSVHVSSSSDTVSGTPAAASAAHARTAQQANAAACDLIGVTRAWGTAGSLATHDKPETSSDRALARADRDQALER